ncbi:MAG: hypothetical protein NTZ08_02700 [Verrucomicrobia bacterium]|nr:hypothetical protein [Verrucomicrobiota bacterium]
MRVARWFIYGFPVFLLLLIAVSFWNSASLTSDKKNEMSLGVLGEPSTLNPIQQADGAASQVAGSIFNGLLKYNQDLEIIGDLAESWSLDQTTTMVFRNEESASAARSQLESLRAEWSAWTLDAVTQSGRELLLHFTEPGLESSKKIRTPWHH